MVCDQRNDFGPAIGTFLWGSGGLGSMVLKCAAGGCSVWGRVSEVVVACKPLSVSLMFTIQFFGSRLCTIRALTTQFGARYFFLFVHGEMKMIPVPQSVFFSGGRVGWDQWC